MRVINDKLHEDLHLPNELFCPYCGGKMNTATSMNTGEVQDGDYGICVGCAEICISVINNDGTHALRKATEDDIDYAKGSSMYKMLLEYQELIRSKKSGLKVKK